MQIPDVGTAGVLYRLFTHLKDYGVILVATSNRHPEELYQGDFADTLFEPFTRVLQETCQVVNLQSGTDYRDIMPGCDCNQGASHN